MTTQKQSSVRDRISRQADIPTETVEVDGLGEVTIRRLKTGRVLELSRLPRDQSGLALVAECALEADGKVVFDSIDDARDVPWSVLGPLLAACNRVNGMTAKVEDAAKN